MSLSPELLDVVWAKAEPHVYCSKEEFAANLEGWDVEFSQGNAFFALVRGPEFHFESTGKGVPLTLKTIRSFLQKIIDKEGYALTRTPHDDERQHRFNRLLGFEKIGQNEFDVVYRIERVR